MSVYVPRAFTPATLREIRNAIASALALSPAASHLYSRDAVDILTAHVAIETGDGTRIVCWGIGNARPRPGENYTSFRTREFIDGVETIVDGSKFAAYPSLAVGAAAHVDLMTGKFAPATELAAAGDAVGFALKLGKLGYYTAPADKYAEAITAALPRVRKLGAIDTAENPMVILAKRAAGWLRELFVKPLLAPCGYRCSVAESIADAKVNGTWVPASAGEDPQPGDLLCSARAGQEPENGGSGHIERAVYWRGAALWSAGGNEADGWVIAPFDLKGKDYRGFIRVDRRIADRCVEITLRECATKPAIREVPGAGAHKRIQSYHAGARRYGGSRAGMPGFEGEGVSVLGPKSDDSVPWCASSANCCTYEALKDAGQ